MTDQAAIDAAKAAWLRIKDQSKPLYEDWICIGRALIAGRTQAMAKAGVNTPSLSEADKNLPGGGRPPTSIASASPRSRVSRTNELSASDRPDAGGAASLQSRGGGARPLAPADAAFGAIRS
jgi:hypothetical protein